MGEYFVGIPQGLTPIIYSTASLNKKTLALIRRDPVSFKTITADNGTEFHQYKVIEEKTGVTFYFATPHHSWERGSNEKHKRPYSSVPT